MVRKATNALWELIDDGMIDIGELVKSFLTFLSEDDVKEFCRVNDINLFLEEDDDGS